MGTFPCLLTGVPQAGAVSSALGYLGAVARSPGSLPPAPLGPSLSRRPQDGSCNGLQHYAALGRDSVGAASVNLLPSDLPQDVYSGVAAQVGAAALPPVLLKPTQGLHLNEHLHLQVPWSLTRPP